MRLFVLLATLQGLLLNVYTFSVGGEIHNNAAPPSKVLVTGAAGRTGRLVLERLMQDELYDPIALVRTDSSGRKLLKSNSDLGLERILVCDVTKLNQAELESATSKAAADCRAMIICTSAVPQVSKVALLLQVARLPVTFITNRFKSKDQRAKLFDFRKIWFYYKPGQYPEKVDYEGQVAQINLAKAVGIPHVVLVSSMGGTDPSNFLNSVGKKPDGSGNGDILLWKRKAEKHLVESGLDFTIIHPGGLVDTVDPKKELRIDVDDLLLENKERSIPRSVVAELCVAALAHPSKTSLDCITSVVDNEPRRVEDILVEFLKTKKTANYTL